jgi:deoxyribonuclease V
VSLTWPDLATEEERVAVRPIEFAYVPGLLSFREGPALIEALGALSRRPDLILVDGQGIAHPRRLGIAAHLGVLLGLPAIGAAKSRLTGTADEPGTARGCRSPLLDGGERIGTLLRTLKPTVSKVLNFRQSARVPRFSRGLVPSRSHHDRRMSADGLRRGD